MGAFSCTINDPVGAIFIVGADVTSLLSGQRIHVASVTLRAGAAGVTEITGTRVKVASSLSGNLCPGCAVVAGRTPMEITGVSNRSSPATRRILQAATQTQQAGAQNPQAGSAHGDTNGDGVFDSTDYLFAQEYSIAPEGSIGCPSFGGSGCTAVSDLTPWQLRQMDPVSDPLSPASAPRGNDLGFLLSVYSGKQRFLERWAAQSDPATGLSLSVRLLDKDSQPASRQCAVKFILATAKNKGAVFRTQSSVTAEGVLVLAEYMGDGWYGINSTGPLEAEDDASFVFMIETTDGTGAGDEAMRRFPFYATHLPPYAPYFPAYQEFASVRIYNHTSTQTLDVTTSTQTPEPGTTSTPTPEPGTTSTPTPEPGTTDTSAETPTQTPQPVLATAVGVSVGAGSGLLVLIGLVTAARRYWHTAVPAVALGSRPGPPIAPMIRVRIRLPRQ
jgi:hypothetical protein